MMYVKLVHDNKRIFYYNLSAQYYQCYAIYTHSRENYQKLSYSTFYSDYINSDESECIFIEDIESYLKKTYPFDKIERS